MKHDWIAMVVYSLTEAQAKAMNEGPIGPPTYSDHEGEVNPEVLPDGRANLRIEDIVHERTAVGCYRCEQVYSDAAAAQRCPGEPVGYTTSGDPRHR